ncbi:hypothetical protein EC973_005106 [Apophysomyces ossiformis]|uniref:Yeast cell wall synthesis Kre9/Knh1-like N-terminal domain-containing protein n=1 Tax=Apophysomyces ossiformis TaxID=679940 RepID=A0A8H7BE37_9FUNG|nr:hypothetical protein EC973_005106 [Apophysomyces ossiformis]
MGLDWINGVDQKVTVRLIQGSNSNTMQPTEYSFKVDGDDGYYQWKIPSDLPSDVLYSFQFQYEDDNGKSAYAYSDPFTILNGKATGSSSGSNSTAATGSATDAATTASTSVSASASASTTASSSNSVTAAVSPQAPSSTPAPLTTSGSAKNASASPTLPATETPKPQNGATQLNFAIALACIPAIASLLLV